MAVKIFSNDSNIKIISKMDDSLDNISEEEWEAYTSSLDESKLRFIPGKNPTRFVMKRTLNYGAQQAITSQQMGLVDGKPEIRLGYILEEVRCALVDIENPAEVPLNEQLIFKKESDGYASKELVAKLHSAGLVMELFGIRQGVVQAIPKK